MSHKKSLCSVCVCVCKRGMCTVQHDTSMVKIRIQIQMETRFACSRSCLLSHWQLLAGGEGGVIDERERMSKGRTR